MSAASSGSTAHAVTLAHNVKSEAEVDSLIAKAKAAGATITRESAKTAWGGYSAYFQDPDRHLWEVAYNPFQWIGPEA